MEVRKERGRKEGRKEIRKVERRWKRYPILGFSAALSFKHFLGVLEQDLLLCKRKLLSIK